MTTSITGIDVLQTPAFDPSTWQDFLPYEIFKGKFSLGETSTEKENPYTRNLSQVMQENRHAGLSLLLNEEVKVINGFKEFAPQLDPIAKVLAEKAKQGGRIVFVGVGSSGRVGIDLSAKVNVLCPGLKCLGIIGGGDCALIQAREGFEDSPEQGMLSAEKLHLTPLDSVFLISASGSASFNAGFGHAAANLGSQVYYFYNSTDIQARTSDLFKRTNNPVQPLLLDIGPQAIIGSTRLQGFSVARICLAYLLGQTMCNFGTSIPPSELSMESFSAKLECALEKLKGIFAHIAQLIDEEHSIFSSPNSNFRRARDETNQGYVTLLGTRSSVRELIMDSVELYPTFFLNPRKREKDIQKRRAEYQAYLVGEPDNKEAWRVSLGRDPYLEEDVVETPEFILSAEAKGNESFAKRPHGPGNLVMGVEVLRKGESLSSALVQLLEEVKNKGGSTTLMIISEESIPEEQKKRLSEVSNHFFFIENLQDDPLGLTFSQLLKWQSNLISNGTMIMVGKVLGNRMIDMRTSNNKLIDRCMRMIEEKWSQYRPNEKLDKANLYQLVISVYTKQKESEELGEYTPSTLKMVLTMLKENLSFEKAAARLKEIDENMDKILN